MTEKFSAYTGLEGLIPNRWKDWSDAEEIIKEAREEGKTLLLFRDLSEATFDALYHNSEHLNVKFKSAYFARESLLVVQLFTLYTEVCHRDFTGRIFRAINSQLPREYRRHLRDVGRTTFDLTDGVRKEADTSLKTRDRRGVQLPTVVIECGLPETMQHFRNMAGVWLRNSNGKVNAVIVICVDPEACTILVEKWKMLQVSQSQQGAARPALVPTCEQEVFVTCLPANDQHGGVLPITQAMDEPTVVPAGSLQRVPGNTGIYRLSREWSYSVTGAPMTVEWKELLDTEPEPPNEGDFSFAGELFASLCHSTLRE